jgi:hypothetical protein
MGQAGLVPLIAAWLRDTQGVEPDAVPKPMPPPGPAPWRGPGPQPREQYTPGSGAESAAALRAVPEPAPSPWPRRTNPTPGTVTLNPRDPVLQWANWRLAQASPEAVEESMLAGGGPFSVGAPGSAIAGVVRSRLGQATRGAKAETAAQAAKLATAEAGAKGPAIIVPGKRVAADVRVREALKSGEYLPEFQPYMGPWEGQGGRAETLSDLVTLGQEAGGGKWYAGMKDLFPRLYQSTNPRAQAGVMASLSPRREAAALTLSGELHKGSNPEMFRRVMDVYEKYGLKGVESRVGPGTQVGIMGSGKENVLRALRGEKIGAEDALKIRSFQDALVEVEDATALDRWWKRILYPGEHAQGKEGFSVPQYLTGQHVVGELAKEHGVSMLDAGGAAWVGIKIIDQGKAEAMLGGQPFKESLRQVWEKHGRDLAPFGPQGQKAAMGLALASLILKGQMPGAPAEAKDDGSMAQKVFGQ